MKKTGSRLWIGVLAAAIILLSAAAGLAEAVLVPEGNGDPAEIRVSWITGIPEESPYTGAGIEPELTVTDPYSGRELEKDKDYEVSYENNTEVGDASAKVDGKGEYKGSVTVTWPIVKADREAPGAPAAAAAAETGITLAALENGEYSMDGASWQDSPVFDGLQVNTAYLFYQRVKEDVHYHASPAAAAELCTADHTPAVIPAVPPTCTGTGLTEGLYCPACGLVFTAQEVIPATGHRDAVAYLNILQIRYDCEICGASHWEWNRRYYSMIPGLVKNGAGENLGYISASGAKNGKPTLSLTPDCEELKEGICLHLTRDETSSWTRQGLQAIELMAGEYAMTIDLASLSLPEGKEEVSFTVMPDGVYMKTERTSDNLWETLDTLLQQAAGEAEEGRAVTLKKREESKESIWDAIGTIMLEVPEDAGN